MELNINIYRGCRFKKKQNASQWIFAAFNEQKIHLIKNQSEE